VRLFSLVPRLGTEVVHTCVRLYLLRFSQHLLCTVVKIGNPIFDTYAAFYYSTKNTVFSQKTTDSPKFHSETFRKVLEGFGNTHSTSTTITVITKNGGNSIQVIKNLGMGLQMGLFEFSGESAN